MKRTLIVIIAILAATGCNFERKSKAQASFDAWWGTLDQTQRAAIMEQPIVWKCPGFECDYKLELTDAGRQEPGADKFVAWWNAQDPAAIEAWVRYVNAEKMRNTMRGKASDDVISEYLSSTATYRPLKLEIEEAKK